jgi:hypothetical protein
MGELEPHLPRQLRELGQHLPHPVSGLHLAVQTLIEARAEAIVLADPHAAYAVPMHRIAPSSPVTLMLIGA